MAIIMMMMIQMIMVTHPYDHDDDHHHLELAEPVHKEDATYMRHAVDEDDDVDSHPHLTTNNDGVFSHPIVHTQSSYSSTLGNRNCKKTTMSYSSGNGAWDHVPTSSLKQKQKEVFDRYALTGFRNKAIDREGAVVEGAVFRDMISDLKYMK